MSDRLVVFLMERVREDREAAQDVIADSPHWDNPEWEEQDWSSLPADQLALRFSPARVLADAEVKRKLAILHRETKADGYTVCYECGPFEDVWFATGGQGNYPCETLRLLALPYADHPDYREWKP